MPTYNLTGLQNVTTLDGALVGMKTALPQFTAYVLLFEFVVIFLGGIYAQNRRIGFSNIPMWGTIAGLITTVSAFLLSAISSSIDLITIIISFSITLVFALWFFLSDLD